VKIRTAGSVALFAASLGAIPAARVEAHRSDAFKAGKLVRLNFTHWMALPLTDCTKLKLDLVGRERPTTTMHAEALDQ